MASSFRTRRATVDRSEFFETADRLAAEGKEVTALSMLNALGGGSFTTIYRHLSEWQDSQPKTSGDGKGDIPDVVQNAFASTWRVAALEAAREIAAAKDKAAEEVQAALKQFKEAIQAIERLEADAEADVGPVAAPLAGIAATALVGSTENNTPEVRASTMRWHSTAMSSPSPWSALTEWPPRSARAR